MRLRRTVSLRVPHMSASILVLGHPQLISFHVLFTTLVARYTEDGLVGSHAIPVSDELWVSTPNLILVRNVQISLSPPRLLCQLVWGLPPRCIQRTAPPYGHSSRISHNRNVQN